MTIDMYQVFRAVQALLALFGVVLSLSNLIEAYRDQQWLLGKGLNGLRAMTASALVIHEAGRLAMQVVLWVIGVLGALLDGGGGAFDNIETLLDTVVVCIVALVSWHSRYIRMSIRQWRAANDVEIRREP